MLLSLSSPVLHKMICGVFKESAVGRVELGDVQESVYVQLLDLWCGKEGAVEATLGGAVVLASVADRLEMLEVGAMLEDVITEQLGVAECGDVLAESGRLGLVRVEAAARRLVLDRFEEVAATDWFLRMEEAVLEGFVDDDSLCVGTEEAALAGVVAWMRGGGDQVRGRGLLSRVRFCLMDSECLAVRVHGMLSGLVGPSESHWVDSLVCEALRFKAARPQQRGTMERRLLGEKAHVARIGRGVPWEWRWGDLGQRLLGHASNIYAVAECNGLMCSGSADGSIRVWDRAAKELRQTLYRGKLDAVRSLVAWEGRLMSGHEDGNIRAWNVATGACDLTLGGHTSEVLALAVVGTRLVSGSTDRAVRIWAMGVKEPWPCERVLLGHTDRVRALATWAGRAISGSNDRSIRVWDLETGECEAQLAGDSGMTALAVRGDRLFSASRTGTIQEWATGTWPGAALRVVAAFELGAGHGQRHVCLAMSGQKLVSGSAEEGYVTVNPGLQQEVRVWDLATLAPEHNLRQAAGTGVWWLTAVGAELWGAVGSEVAVWGRDLGLPRR